jgi:hypothetical protein
MVSMSTVVSHLYTILHSIMLSNLEVDSSSKRLIGKVHRNQASAVVEEYQQSPSLLVPRFGFPLRSRCPGTQDGGRTKDVRAQQQH